jgi:putative flippase GtrA
VKNKLSEQRLVRYIAAGAASYAVELSCLLVLYKLFGLSAELATALAFWVGLATSFFLQKLFAFRDYQKTAKTISKQLGTYSVLVGFNYLFTISLVALFPAHLVIISRTIALILTTAWNYILYKKFIFTPRSTNLSPIVLTSYVLGFLNNRRNKILFFIALCLPILLFFYQYLATGNNRTFGGDFDYYSQLYEAFRISVLKFHQLPFWNPWLSGGIPLFANPQFGLFSIQSLLVLPFGAIYGLKIAYVVYALIGFWGMYAVGQRVLGASKARSALVGYIWVFGGFFAGHSVSHLTFTSFFLLPWLLYFIVRRRHKYSWLWLGIVESVIILSSVHYALLMMTLAMAIYFVISLARVQASNLSLRFSWELTRADILFILKTTAAVIILAGYQLYATYHFESHNQRLTEAFAEPVNPPALLIKALFLPIGTVMHYPKTVWLWGEYSMYLGLGTGLAILLCLAYFMRSIATRKTAKTYIKNKPLVLGILIVGLVGALLSMGDFGKFSPFYLLHSLPGFTQTRVPSRWLIMTAFSLLIFLLAWRRNKRVINFLLLLSVTELFLSNGPPRVTGQHEFIIPPAKFSSSFSQYDNGLQHLGAQSNIMHSYYYATSRNIGQIYADDSLINTLSASPPLLTDRCGQNVNPACTFVQTSNAVVTFWSPNKITLKRTGDGPIKLNMNVESGWRVNGVYPFASIPSLQPSLDFVLTDNLSTYTLEYAPKLSPSWVAWRWQRL